MNEETRAKAPPPAPAPPRKYPPPKFPDRGPSPAKVMVEGLKEWARTHPNGEMPKVS